MINIITIPVIDGNATPAVRAALERVRPNVKNRIVFEGERYLFYKEGALRDMFFVSNNKSSEKDVIFPIIDKSDVEICGGGAEFIFCGRVTPFVIINSNNIKLCDFIIDFSFPRHLEGYVKSVNDKALDILIDKDVFGFKTKNGNVLFNAGEDVLTTSDRKLFIVDKTSKKHVCYLFAGDSTESRENLAAPAMFTDAYETEDGIRFEFREGSKIIDYNTGDLLLISNDENRENSVIFAEDSSDISVNRVTVYRGAGMGFIGQLCENISFDKFDVLPKKGRDSLLSITADIVHLIHCNGTARITNCRFEKSVDDSINIHGAYARVNRVLNNTQITVDFCHEEQSGLIPFKAGDTVHINDGESLDETGVATIKDINVTPSRDIITLTFDDNIKGRIKEGDFLENPDRMPEVYILNNTILDCPHIRMSSSKKTVIENNTLDHIHEDIFISDMMKYWYESGVTTFVSIKNNTFLGSHDSFNISVSTGRTPDTKRLHGRVVIENNRFNRVEKDTIKASHVTDLIINNNSFK